MGQAAESMGTLAACHHVLTERSPQCCWSISSKRGKKTPSDHNIATKPKFPALLSSVFFRAFKKQQLLPGSSRAAWWLEGEEAVWEANAETERRLAGWAVILLKWDVSDEATESSFIYWLPLGLESFPVSSPHWHTLTAAYIWIQMRLRQLFLIC